MIIHGNLGKSKKRKVSKADQLRNELWLKSIEAIAPKPKKITKFKPTYSLGPGSAPPGRETVRYPSRVTVPAVATKAESKVYTGTKVMGIATMHKSNAVPVFNSEEAVEISSMRR